MKVGIQRLSLICPQEEIQNQWNAASGNEVPEEGSKEDVSNEENDNIDVNTEENQYADNFEESIDTEEENFEVAEKVMKQKVIVKVVNEGEEAINDIKK